MYKFASRVIIFGIAVFLGMIVSSPSRADAALPLDVPAECQVYVDEREDYLMAVIGNYQEALDYEKSQVVYWQEAHDRVAANAVERNYEYAAEVEKNRKLKDKLRYWKELAQKRK